MSGPRHPSLPGREYDRIFAVLDDCGAARDLPDLKLRLMDSLHDRYGFPNTTFLTGPTFRGAFRDPDPVATGRIPAILDEYHSGWYLDDMFSTKESFSALARTRAISHSGLRSLPSGAVNYLQGFLYRHRLRSASVLHLGLAHSAHAMVGIFDDEGKEIVGERLAGLGLLAQQLTLLARTLPGNPEGSWRSNLTPRQRELGELIADGNSNEEIAAILSIQLDTVKKHVSHILTATGARNRVEFAKIVLTEELSRR